MYVVISFIVILAFLSYQKVDNDAQGSKKLSINPPSLSQSSSSRQTSSPSPPLLPVSSTSSVSEKSSVQPIRAAQQIEEAYVKYVYAMVNAINEGDFGQVSSFLLKGSPLWNSQIALVKNLSRKRITEKVIEAHVIEIRRLSENSMMLKTKETITIQYPSGKKSTKSYLWNYKAIFSGEYILFSDIEKSVSGPFPEAISSQQIEEVYVKYVYAMVNAINEGDFGQVSSFLLKGSPLWNSQIALVKNLSRKGITEKVNEAHVIEIRRLSENSMVLKTKETITIQYPSGKNSIKSYLWNYKATFSGGYILFSDIAKGSS